MDYSTNPLTRSYYTLFALRARGQDGGHHYVGRRCLTDEQCFAFVSESEKYMEKVARELRLEDIFVSPIHTDKPLDYAYIHRCEKLTRVGSPPTEEYQEENDDCPVFAVTARNPETNETQHPMEVMASLNLFNRNANNVLAPKWLCDGDPIVITEKDTYRDIKDARKSKFIKEYQKTETA